MSRSATRRTDDDAPEARLSWSQVMAWRVRRHHLDQRLPPEAMLAVASRLCGLHAQLMSSTELSLWSRIEGLDRDAVRHALWQERSLVKTWAMRGTLHLLPSDEYPLWQAALGTYRHYLKPSWFRYFGVTNDELEQIVAAVATALDGRMLTREQLAEQVTQLTGSAALGDKLLESWGALLKPASFRGQLCFAPDLGRNVRFTRPDTWLGERPLVDADGAMLDVTRRFFAAYAPASRDDFARWWGTTPAQTTTLLRSLGDEVVGVQVEGKPAWMLSVDVADASDAMPPGSVRLLPAFDPYVIGATGHAEHLLPGPQKARVYRSQGWISPVLLVDGRMDGVWKYERTGDRLAVRIEPFVDLPQWARQRAESEAERLAAFLGGTLELTWETP